MKRKEFIQKTTILSTGAVFLPGLFSRQNNSNKLLKGFIVSDSHFGWNNPAQPSPERQRKMMETILKQFPDLDLFIDTGDAHHNDRQNFDPKKSREDWVDIIQGGCGQLPFYYTAGNHDIDACYDKDPETDCNRMGSVSCRPYYSWDMKGVHFVSIPELVKTVFVNKEILEWVEFDLELNKNKTTILLSHNQLLQTTSGYEPGYRGLLNTDEIWGLMKRYPNVKAWMHGHNHNYEMVEKNGVLFISNGRIGGFDPSNGAQGLGGIYFEITKNQLIAKSFSAEKEKFLTRNDVNDKMLLQYYPGRKLKPDAVLRFHTSLDQDALPSYSYGMGGANSGTVISAAHHHAFQKGSSVLYIKKSDNLTLNEDPDFKYFIRSGRWGEKDKKTSYMGGKIKGEYEWLDPNGVKLLQSKGGPFALIDLPNRNFGKYCYYKVGPGTSYVASVKFADVTGKQTAQMECRFCDALGNEISIVKSDLWFLDTGSSERSFQVQTPGSPLSQKKNKGQVTEDELHMSFKLYVDTSKGDVILRRVAIEPVPDNGDPVLYFDGNKCEYSDIQSYAKYEIPNPTQSNSICEVHAQSSERLTWLVRHEGWDWQVRNAAIKDNGDSLEFTELRNIYAHKMEVVFAPSRKLNEPYVFKIRHARKAKVYPLNRGNRKLHFVIDVLVEGKSFAEVEVINLKGNRVMGAEIIKSGYNSSILKVPRGKNVIIG